MPEKKDSHHIWKESSKMKEDQDEPNTEPTLYADKNTEKGSEKFRKQKQINTVAP